MNLKVRGKERIFWIVLLAAVLVHLAAYMLIAYPAMPQTVPTHWGVEGTVDGWSSKGGDHRHRGDAAAHRVAHVCRSQA